MELNIEQIIKALECCQFRHIKNNCDECKYHRWCEPSCRDLLCQDSLSLIKQLTEEVNDLKEDKELYSVFCEDYKGQVEDLKAISEQYQKQFEDCYEEKAKLTKENEKLTINMNAYGLTAKRLGEENERLRAEKKRGYWFTDYARQPMVVCSNCNLSNNYSRSKYCPHCGARMDGK